MAKRSVPVTRGSLSHLIVPQSKSWVSTSAGVTNRRPGSLDMLVPFAAFGLEFQVFEILYLRGNGAFGGQTLDARGAEEAGDAPGAVENVLNILRLGNWAAMAKDQNLGTDGDSSLLDGLNAVDRLIEGDGGSGTDGPFGG